jgi:hypothetical protein
MGASLLRWCWWSRGTNERVGDGETAFGRHTFRIAEQPQVSARKVAGF